MGGGWGGGAQDKSDGGAFPHMIKGVVGKKEAGPVFRQGEIPGKRLSGTASSLPGVNTPATCLTQARGWSRCCGPCPRELTV